MSDATRPTDASPSPSDQTSRSGTATTAAGTVGSQTLGVLNSNHIRVLQARGLDVELLVTLGVGASSRLRGNCVGIPYLENGQRVQTKYRTLDADKRFTQDLGGKSVLWNGDVLRDESLAAESIVITEGEFDAMAALQSGFPRTVSVPCGAPPRETDGRGTRYQFLDDALPLMRDARDIVLAVDGDATGANLLHDLALRIGRARCKWVRYPIGKDLNDVLRERGEDGVREVIRTAQWIRLNGVYTLDQLPPFQRPEAIMTGMVGMDEHYKVRRGDLVVVTGIPGHGKTSFVTELCCRLALNRWRTAFASFETDQDDMLQALRSFRSERLETMMTDDEKARADAWIGQHFAFIAGDIDDNVDLSWLLERAAAAVIRHDADVLVIDPWNEMDHQRPPDMSLTEYVGFAIRELRRFAKKYGVHVIVVAHPAKMQRSRDGSYPRPSLYDISDSAHWANKPDLGIVIHRPDITNSITEISIVKSRNYRRIGRPGTVKAIWNDDKTRYTIADEPELL
jgi:twinkle protein